MSAKMLSIAFILLASASHAQTKRTPIVAEAKVQSALAGMVRASDKAFVKTWTEASDELVNLGITADQVKKATRWGGAAYSLGICNAQDNKISNWIIMFDDIIKPDSENANNIKAMFYKIGIDSLKAGKSGNVLDNLTAAEKAGYCSVELAAVDRLLAMK
jgi:hypothetical protein